MQTAQKSYICNIIPRILESLAKLFNILDYTKQV